MNIAVIGANGRSGQVFVEQALAAGHQIKAGVRSAGRLTSRANLLVQLCDATNEEQLRQLVSGQDAVVSLIGHVRGSAADVQTVAMQKLVKVMGEAGPKRLISLTGTGVRFSGDQISFLDWFMNTGVTMIDPSRVKDGIDCVEIIKKSNLDWTVIRVLKLTESRAGTFRLTEHGPAKSFVPRIEVAQAILQVLEEYSFIEQAPVVGY